MSNQAFDISNAAVLSTLSITRFSNAKPNKKVTDDVKLRRALGQASGKWVQNLLDPEFIAPLVRSGRDIYDYHVAHTLPYDNNGTRILLASYQQEYSRRMEELCGLDRVAIGVALASYEAKVKEAKTTHGDSFDAGQYPNIEGFAAKFTVTLKYDPVPSSNHFSNQLAKGHLDRMQQQFNQRTQEIVRQAEADAWRQLIAPVQHIVTTLEKDDPKIFDSLIGNVNEVLGRLDAINLTNDAQLKAFAAATRERIANINVESLKASSINRNRTKQAAAALIEQFGTPGMRKFAA
jgi:hypothetical protein